MLLLTACENPFNLSTALGIGTPRLSVSPGSASIATATTIDLTVSSGSGIYNWAIISDTGSGTLSAATGTTVTFDPQNTAGIAIVQVTDDTGIAGTVTITSVDSAVDPLQLLAATNTLQVGEFLDLFALGGVPAYSWIISSDTTGGANVGGGSTGSFIAGPNPGSVTVELTDSDTPPSPPLSWTCTIVADPTDIDYVLDGVTITPPDAIAGGFIASMDYSNAGGATGAPVTWNAYFSTTTSLNGVIAQAGSGSLGALAAGAVSPGNSISGGTWPSVSGAYYVIVVLSAPGDSDTGNNTYVSAQYGLTVDYQVPVQPTGSSVSSSDSININFDMDNTGGSVDGSGSVYWTAYLSNDITLGTGDVQLQTSNILALDNDGAVATITVNAGTWPLVAAPEDWYVILEWYSDDDPSTVRTQRTAAFNVSPADISYEAVVIPGGDTYLTGTAVSETFTLENSGADDGGLGGTWKAYISVNDTLEIPGDILIDSGSFPGLLGSNAQSATITINDGFWPTTPGGYDLILEWTSDEDPTTPKLQDSTAFTINAPDVNYSATAWPLTDTVTAGEAYNLSFTIENQGGDDGTAPGTWIAYLSTDGAYSPGDVELATGALGPINSTLTQAINLAGNWPEDDINRYIVLRWSSPDEVSVKEQPSGQFVLSYPDADYRPEPGSLTASGNLYTGGSFAAEVTFENTGSQAGLGTDLWDWEVYVSLNNATSIDTGDILVASGVDQAVLGSSGTVPFNALNADWPLQEGTYYLKARVTAPHDTNTANDIAVSSSSYFIFNASDYQMDGFTSLPASMGIAQDFPGATFEFSDGANVTNTEPVYWKVYASPDQSLDADSDSTAGEDYLVFEGVITTPPSSNGTTPVNIPSGSPLNDIGAYGKGIYPFVGPMYLIATITSSTDNDPSNNMLVSDQVYVYEGFGVGNPDYYTDQNSYSSIVDGFVPGGVAVVDADITHVNEIHRIDLWENVTITGAADDNDHVDTFHFFVADDVEELEVRLQWSSGENHDLFFWEEPYSGAFVLDDNSPNAEPASAYVTTMAVTPGITEWYVSIFFNGNGTPGALYDLHIKGSAP